VTNNPTLDPELQSWIESANSPSSDFPIQNLPFGRFRKHADSPWLIGVAIGDMVLDLKESGLINHSDMSQILAMSRQDRLVLRKCISDGLKKEAPINRRAFESALLKMSSIELGLPCDVSDYTDFYVGIHHATAVGKLFRPDNPLLPNYKWVPIGYHGRSSTLQVSGKAFRRPAGQIKTTESDIPVVKPTSKLDFELELGVIIGQANAQGEPIDINAAEDHIFGLTLFNDWSARDIQAWEYQPLGPFLGKNFASTVSPWIVTLEALEPFRKQFDRAGVTEHSSGDSITATPLEYLNSKINTQRGSFDIKLEVLIQTSAMRSAGLPFECISYSDFNSAAYWTLAQLVTHHTLNGCALRPGDLFGTGTLSGPHAEQAGSLLELTQGGQKSITLKNGESRTFLLDGDTINFRGWCEKPGATRIGFGECSATVLSVNG
jgi:fumarylacetoacetase